MIRAASDPKRSRKAASTRPEKEFGGNGLVSGILISVLELTMERHVRVKRVSVGGARETKAFAFHLVNDKTKAMFSKNLMMLRWILKEVTGATLTQVVDDRRI
jgi:hypothetical protein